MSGLTRYYTYYDNLSAELYGGLGKVVPIYLAADVEAHAAALRAQLSDERKPDGYLHGWPRNDGTVLIGVGVHCAGCGKSFGITNVAFSDDYVAPTEKPSWPWPEADCAICNAEERWRKKMAIDPLAERLRAKLKEQAK